MKKGSNNTNIFFFDDKPLFGLDIGHNMVRVMQLDMNSRLPKLIGYGSVVFDMSAIEDGVIVKPELIAKSIQALFSKELIGDISTKRVAVSLPAGKAYTHAVQLPKMSAKDLAGAVQSEAEQYLPQGTDNQYIDFSKIRDDDDGIEVLIVSVPKPIVDSYLLFTQLIGLEAVLFETAIGASAKLFALDKQSDIPSVLVDFGASSTDLTVYNHGLVVTGTVPYGGDNVTETISQALHISAREAIMIKSKYGLSASDVQNQVRNALRPSLELLLKEIRRTVRYYEQRYTKEPPIGQVITMGGGANMPGLADYLTDQLRLPVRSIDLSSHIDFRHLHHFYSADRMSYITAAGLAVVNPKEIF
jgi:type IV pilus assembly protein PilM